MIALMPQSEFRTMATEKIILTGIISKVISITLNLISSPNIKAIMLNMALKYFGFYLGYCQFKWQSSFRISPYCSQTKLLGR
jgi:hypothetical protein